MPELRRICGWCGAWLGGPAGAPVTAGVCARCRKDLLPVFLDTLDGPTLLLDGDARAQSANAAARAAAGKGLREIEGRLFGDIFDCRNAPLPGGCGKTSRCSTCVIRANIEDTFKTGTAHEAAPAVVHKDTGEAVPLRVSTRRVKQGVLLRVEPAPPGSV